METATTLKTKWTLDPTHSEVNFKVKHLVISTVSGTFQKFDGSVETDGDNFENAKVEFTIDPSSIHTNQAQRDEHLRSAEFFNTAEYDAIIFRSTSLEKTGDNS